MKNDLPQGVIQIQDLDHLRMERSRFADNWTFSVPMGMNQIRSIATVDHDAYTGDARATIYLEPGMTHTLYGGSADLLDLVRRVLEQRVEISPAVRRENAADAGFILKIADDIPMKGDPSSVGPRP